MKRDEIAKIIFPNLGISKNTSKILPKKHDFLGEFFGGDFELKK